MRNRHFEYHEQIDTNMPKDILHVRHNAGFFSCSFAALEQVMMYYNENGKLPDELDRSSQYMYYKHQAWDNLIPFLFNDGEGFFNPRKHYITDDTRYSQFSDYKNLRHQDLKPFIAKYFSLSDRVQERANQFISDYEIDLNITCAVFHRSNDKVRETELPHDGEIIQRGLMHELRTLVIPDTVEFGNYCTYISDKCFVISQNPTMPHDATKSTFMTLPPSELPEHAINFLATVWIASQCKHLVTHSGNGGLWACIYRGHNEGIEQFLNGQWI